MQKKRKNIKQKRLGIKLIASGVVLCAVLVFIDRKIEPTVSGICEYECKILTYDMVNDSLNDEFEDDQFNCEDFIIFTTDTEGNITSVNTDMIKANDVVGRVANVARARLENHGARTSHIKIGTLCDTPFLYDRGFSIPVQIKPQGWIETSILSEFTETGINQTTLEIIIEVKVTMTAQMPLYSHASETKIQVPIAQTMIIGKIPDYIGSGSLLAKNIIE